jgi:hypothetical protein
MTTEKQLTIPEQITKALDGRTRRWLSLKAEIPEYDLSKKMNGGLAFKDEELARIEEKLNFKIEVPNDNLIESDNKEV